MKGKRWLLWILTVCLLAVCCGAMADEWAPKGKTEAVSDYGVSELNQPIFARNVYSLSKNERTGTSVMLEGADGAMEQATSVEVTFLSGDEALKNLLAPDRQNSSFIWVNTPAEGVIGEATFRIRAEGPTLYLEKEVHPEVRILDIDASDLDAFIYQIEIGKEIDILSQVAFDVQSRSLPFFCRADCNLNGIREADTDEYLMNFFSFTARQEGDWWLDLNLGLDQAGTSINVPLILHTGDTLRPETASKLADYRAANGITPGKEKAPETETAAGAEKRPETGTAEGTEESSAATAAGAEESRQQAAGQSDDMKDLAGYWKTAEFLADGKKVAEKDEVALSMYLNISGRGYLVLKQAQMTVGMLLSWKTTDSGMELIPDSGQNQIALTRNDDGSMSLRVDELAITIVQQDWKIESMAKKTEKPENLTGRWVDMGTEIENIGVLPQELIEFSGAQNPEHLIYINETGFVSYFLKKDGQTSIRMLNLEKEEGQLVAKEMLYTDSGTPDYATYPVSIYENGWLEISLYGQRKFFARDDFWGISISAKDEPKTVAAGKSVTFTAEFEQPEKVKEIDGNVYWSVARQDGGELGDIASIDKKGVLKISRDLQEKVALVVKGKSGGNTSDTYTIEAVPTLKKLTIEPDKAVLYLGETEPLTVRVIAEPADAMPEKLDWKVNGKAAELETDGAYSVRIKAVQAGKATVQVKDAGGGKNAKMTVNVLEPVTAVEISGPETVKAGKTASYKAVLEPKKPGDKTVIWSVDTDESIATVNKNGQVKVSKNAPSGIVITLTAQAPGSPKEVKDTFQITVE